MYNSYPNNIAPYSPVLTTPNDNITYEYFLDKDGFLVFFIEKIFKKIYYTVLFNSLIKSFILSVFCIILKQMQFSLSFISIIIISFLASFIFNYSIANLILWSFIIVFTIIFDLSKNKSIKFIKNVISSEDYNNKKLLESFEKEDLELSEHELDIFKNGLDGKNLNNNPSSKTTKTPQIKLNNKLRSQIKIKNVHNNNISVKQPIKFLNPNLAEIKLIPLLDSNPNPVVKKELIPLPDSNPNPVEKKETIDLPNLSPGSVKEEKTISLIMKNFIRETIKKIIQFFSDRSLLNQLENDIDNILMEESIFSMFFQFLCIFFLYFIILSFINLFLFIIFYIIIISMVISLILFLLDYPDFPRTKDFQYNIMNLLKKFYNFSDKSKQVN